MKSNPILLLSPLIELCYQPEYGCDIHETNTTWTDVDNLFIS